jgi:hypothetical protein
MFIFGGMPVAWGATQRAESELRVPVPRLGCVLEGAPVWRPEQVANGDTKFILAATTGVSTWSMSSAKMNIMSPGRRFKARPRDPCSAPAGRSIPRPQLRSGPGKPQAPAQEFGRWLYW